MKSVKSLLLIALLALGFVACEKDPATDEKSPVIKVDATEIKLNSHGESLEIGYRIENVEPSERKSVKVENLAEWLDVEVGEETILLTAEKNNTTQGRIINIIVKYEGAESVEITVMQENIEVPRENLTLELEISEIGPTSITIDIKASHPDKTSIPRVTYKE